MINPICLTCGTQFSGCEKPPEGCPVCEDERQFVGWEGQRWTTLDDLGRDHRTRIQDDSGLLGIGIEPAFAIGQRALLVETSASRSSTTEPFPRSRRAEAFPPSPSATRTTTRR